MQFDWQTDENSDWDGEEVAITAVARPASPWRRRAVYVLLLLGIVGLGVAGGGYWLLRQYTERATADTEAEILRSHQVIEAAAFGGDRELFSTNLSGLDSEWAAALENLVQSQAYQNREAFGLVGLPSTGETAVVTTTLSPDFTTAEVISEYPYSYSIGNDLTQTIGLQMTAVYRRGENRWLLAPPREDFWGGRLSKAGFFLSLQFPSRDQAIAERLALDMDTTLAAICAHSAFTCPADMQVNVLFSSDPASLLPRQSAIKWVTRGQTVILPTPTLVGLPKDEAAYQALSRGYQLQLVEPILLELANFDLASVAGTLFLDSWMAWYLDLFALRPYPLSFSALAQLQGVSLVEASQSWTAVAETASPEEKLMAYAFMQFIVRHITLPSTAFNELDGQALRSNEWLLEKSPYGLEELEARWQEQLLKQPLLETESTMPTGVATTIPAPTQSTTGELHIFSEPEGAAASIVDENLIGQTPATWMLLPGTYTVTVSLEGYKDWVTPITVTVGTQQALTATLRQQHTIIPMFEGRMGSSNIQWSEDGQRIIYSTVNREWPAHVTFLPVYKNWWVYEVASGNTEELTPPQTRVTNAVRESLGVCPFPLPENFSYPPCSAMLHESPISNRIAFSSMLMGHNVNSWLADIDGTDAVHLETIPEAPSDVMWSSDDQWLLIGAYAGIDYSNVYYIVSSDGTFVESLGELTNTSHWLVQGIKPQFSPDGQRVAFVGIETRGSQLTWEQENQEDAYNLYVIDLTTMEHQVVSARFGLFQWSADGNGLYILDGSANTVGNTVSHQMAQMAGAQYYADFYYIDLTQDGYPEEKLASDIPIHLPDIRAWAYSPEARAMAGTFQVDGQGSVLGVLLLP